ncbi:hypothetical protein ACGFX8_28000 [Streptomyces sp. NPDC048362]
MSVRPGLEAVDVPHERRAGGDIRQTLAEMAKRGLGDEIPDSPGP